MGKKARAAKNVLVLLESMAGTGHRIFRARARTADKLEFTRFDPIVRAEVVYQEKYKEKSMKK